MERRFLVGQRAVLRASLVVAGLAVSGVAAIAGPLLALLHPDRAAPILVLYALTAALGLAVAFAVRVPGRRFPRPLAFALALAAEGAALLTLAIIPEDHLFAAAILVVIPVAVSLLLPIGRRLHLLWLVAAGLGLAAFVVSPLMPGSLPVEERRDIVMAVAVGAFVSVVGQQLVERLRRRAFDAEWRARERLFAVRRLNRGLEETLAHVRRLEGLLSICAGCKSVRDEGGVWVPVERYVRERAEVEFSHGICPDCLRRLYPDFADAVEGAAEGS
jgi:hypothetical protein